MLPELGQFSLILALGLSALPMFLLYTKIAQTNVMRSLALGQAFFVTLAFMILLTSFVKDDFSVQYVARNSNSNLPIYYKFTALWGAHEGSLLLWLLILNWWILGVFVAAKKWPHTFSNLMFASLSMLNAGLLILTIHSSNPFLRIATQLPLEGADLNPLLQDFGMIIHPPVLYVGYVGTSVVFAFAVAALVNNKLDQAWAMRLRPWVLCSWLFLTLGIALGSWWAYYELGWGGWWFWDPVENASFMPWLTTTALIHSLAHAGRTGRGLMLAVFLAIVSFGLSILGTFLVRSGSISSVHAFANDPQRGVFILQFFTLTVGGALLLYIYRALRLHNTERHEQRLNKNWLIILANNILLLVAAATVLLGTVYPMLYELITHKKISVGYPYFVIVFVPVALVILTVMLVSLTSSKKFLFISLLVASGIALAFLLAWFGAVYISSFIGISLALAIIVGSIAARSLTMALAHVGLAISVIGISITPAYEIEKDLRLQVGDSINIAAYNITFAGVAPIDGPNYVGYKGEFIVNKVNKSSRTLYPQKRLYLATELPMTETAILPGLFQDIYIALGQQLDTNTWSARIYYKPFVRWIWLGAIIMALSGLIGLLYSKPFKRLHLAFDGYRVFFPSS